VWEKSGPFLGKEKLIRCYCKISPLLVLDVLFPEKAASFLVGFGVPAKNA
jgi:hypothetical protein